jgi:enolase-phosphatase E1
VILLDIEGTTTPIVFVTETLFPYARGRLREFIARHHNSAEIARTLAVLRDEYASEPETEKPPWSEVGYAEWLMDRDRKSPALKDLQGRIWEEGYQQGVLTAPVFEDVPPALDGWARSGSRAAIYSSGSVRAQQWLFRRSSAGDLTSSIAAYFDTAIGPKREATSYARIARTLNRHPSQMLFVSDVAAELDAARAAGLQTALCVRPGNPAQPGHDHSIVTTLLDIPIGGI